MLQAVTTSSIAQPFVKWVGGKRSLLLEILPRISKKFGAYYEPFVGGGAVYFALAGTLRHATLVDINLELIITYNVIKNDPHALIEQLELHAAKHSPEYFYTMRWREPRHTLTIAARFLYLNKTCFNGLYRVNSHGMFNTPIGRYEHPNIIQAGNLLACHHALQNADILFGDFTIHRPSGQGPSPRGSPAP